MRPERAGALAGLGLVTAWWAPASAPVFPPVARLHRIPLRLERARGIALTFDDGPHPEGTRAVLSLLEAAGVRASFFLVGERLESAPGLAAEIAAGGHEIAVHGYAHRLLLRRSPREVAEDFARAEAAIGEASGVEARFYRPPYGVFSLAALALARRRWEPVLWSRWGRDWERRANAESIARRATRELSGGDIVLLHDSDAYSVPGSWRATVAALPAVIEAARATGEPLVTLSERL